MTNGQFPAIPRKERRKLLRFINREYTKKGRPPSIREIQDYLELSSTSVASYRVDNLTKDGYLEKEPEVARGLKITPDGMEFMG